AVRQRARTQAAAVSTGARILGNPDAAGLSNLGKPKEVVRMKSHAVFPLLAAAGALFLAGCNSFQSRARERAWTYEQLSSSDQQRLQRGVISVGDNEDMVYIALGHPDESRTVTTADGSHEVWVYKS